MTAAEHTNDIVVLKVGGSLTESDAAVRLMRALSLRRFPRLVIVPGGGTFADGVRAAQTQHNLSEAAAHHMALLAMQQCAVMLADFASGFVLADAPAQFEAAWSSGLTPIWLPASMVLSANEVACSWEVTSDSLAAWLADRIGAARLLLVKACALPVVRDAPALATAGVVDASFPAYVKGRRFSWEVLSEDAALAAL